MHYFTTASPAAAATISLLSKQAHNAYVYFFQINIVIIFFEKFGKHQQAWKVEQTH